MNSHLIQYKFTSSLGPIYLIADDSDLLSLSFYVKKDIPLIHKSNQIIAETVIQLDEYLLGKRYMFNLPLRLDGTDFQKLVWNTLISIPYGETISYEELAKSINNKGAVRAVGSANARNPLCIVIPCHRVVNKSGKLGGYAGGMNRKERLINLELDHYFK